MKLVSILIALLIVGFLSSNYLGSSAERETNASPSNSTGEVPKVPTTLRETQNFGNDMEQYLQDEAAKRVEAIEEAESQ